MTMRTFFIFFKKGTGYIGNAISQCKHTPGHGLLPECYHFGAVAGGADYALRNFPL